MQFLTLKNNPEDEIGITKNIQFLPEIGFGLLVIRGLSIN
jgi:hypothetical protein